MSDILYDAANNFKTLLNIKYHFILGRKGKTYEINLSFAEESFFHLAGLQHLPDITYPSQNKERIYKEILKQNITIDTLQQSCFYKTSGIEDRISNLYRLEAMLDSCQLMFYINPHEYLRYTSIDADYLCEYIDTTNLVITTPPTTTLAPDIFYFFITKQTYAKSDNEYCGRSFFRKQEIDYKRGTSETKILLSEKITGTDTPTPIKKELYRSPNYKV